MGKLLFVPVGIISGLLAGQIGKRLFTLMWGVVDDREAPKPEHRDVDYGKLVAALLIEGAVFAVIKGLVDHFARRGYARLTGSWPGEAEPDPA
jgi:hypothetical protein